MSGSDLARALLAPDSVALIGASADSRRTTSRPLRYLKNHGFKGRVLPINPNRKAIDGVPCYPDLASAPGPIDHAFILLPGNAAAGVIAQCGKAGVTCATVLAGDFADGGAAGRRRQDRLQKAAEKTGVRLIGPNSIGIVNTHHRMALSVNAAFDTATLTPGRLGVIAHSGSLLGALVSRGAARNIHFSKLVSIGNEADLTLGEVGDMLVDDDETDAILLFLETLRGRAHVERMARRAFRAGKPVIAYKLGRSEQGRALAVSHTGAMAGEDSTIDAFLSHFGIVRVGMFDTLYETPPLLTGRKPRRGKGGKVAVLTTTGGGGAMVVDCLGSLGVSIAPVSKAVREVLARHKLTVGTGGLIDLTMAGTDAVVVGDIMSALMAAANIDAVVMVVGSSAQFHPELAVAPLKRWADAPKPLAVHLAPEAADSARMLADAGVAVFRTPESCADGLAACLARRPPARRAAKPKDADARHLSETAVVLKDASTHGDGDGGAVDNAFSLETFNCLGITTAESRLIPGPEDAVTAVLEVGLPAAVKIVAKQAAHKTDIGGVELNITGGTELAAACSRVVAGFQHHHPGVAHGGILVQKMETGMAEAIIGYRLDALAGPVVTVGVGGVLAEIYRDFAVRLAPVTLAQARAMINEVKGLAPIRGYRGQPRGDVDALAQAVVALSGLAHLDGPGGVTVTEAEINPLLVKGQGEGAVAVDGLIVIAR